MPAMVGMEIGTRIRHKMSEKLFKNWFYASMSCIGCLSGNTFHLAFDVAISIAINIGFKLEIGSEISCYSNNSQPDITLPADNAVENDGEPSFTNHLRKV